MMENPGSSREMFVRVHDLAAESPGPPVIRLANLILEEFLRAGAEQLSLTQGEGDYSPVRFLIEGQWRDVMKIPVPAAAPLMNRYKVMANLDIARRPAQRGQLHVRLAGTEYVLRITSTIPSPACEELVVAFPETDASTTTPRGTDR